MGLTKSLDSRVTGVVLRRTIETNDPQRGSAQVDYGPPQPMVVVCEARPSGPVWARVVATSPRRGRRANSIGDRA